LTSYRGAPGGDHGRAPSWAVPARVDGATERVGWSNDPNRDYDSDDYYAELDVYYVAIIE
jgi:hypothetical protein